MPDDDDLRNLLKPVHLAFTEAETAIKLVETRSNRGMVQPAVNELRYATNHIFRCVFPPDGETAPDNAKKAIGHCNRARYDAAEGGIKLCLSEVKAFQYDYRRINIVDVIPDYVDIRKQIRAAHESIQAATNGSQKEVHAAECTRQFQVMAPLVQQLEDARSELNKLEIARRTELARWAVGTILAAVGVTATLYAVLT